MQPAGKPSLGDVENPVNVSDSDLKSRLKSLGKDLGFQETIRTSASPSKSPEKVAEVSRDMSDAKKQLDTFQMKIPRYLMQQLAQNAVTRRVTRKYLVLEALKSAGYQIEQDDLQEDGRRDR